MRTLFDRIHFFLETWFQSEPSPDREVGIVARFNFTPERYETCLSFSRLRFARTCSPSSPPPTCCRPPRIALRLATRSTRRSTTRPTSSPRRASTTAPATSTTCSTALATACRSCGPPTPASPRCRSWSIPQSRSPTRCCRLPPVIAPNPASPAARTPCGRVRVHARPLARATPRVSGRARTRASRSRA